MWPAIFLGAVFGCSGYFLYADVAASALRWWPVLNAGVASGAVGGILWMIRPPRQVTLKQRMVRPPPPEEDEVPADAPDEARDDD